MMAKLESIAVVTPIALFRDKIIINYQNTTST